MSSPGDEKTVRRSERGPVLLGPLRPDEFASLRDELLRQKDFVDRLALATVAAYFTILSLVAKGFLDSKAVGETGNAVLLIPGAVLASMVVVFPQFWTAARFMSIARIARYIRLKSWLEFAYDLNAKTPSTPIVGSGWDWERWVQEDRVELENQSAQGRIRQLARVTKEMWRSLPKFAAAWGGGVMLVGMRFYDSSWLSVPGGGIVYFSVLVVTFVVFFLSGVADPPHRRLFSGLYELSVVIVLAVTVLAPHPGKSKPASGNVVANQSTPGVVAVRHAGSGQSDETKPATFADELARRPFLPILIVLFNWFLGAYLWQRVTGWEWARDARIRESFKRAAKCLEAAGRMPRQERFWPKPFERGRRGMP